MKITFFGTSHGVPAPDRFCSCAAIESGDAIYLIDAGAPVNNMLMKHGMDIHALRAVFTTHAHGDHIDGLIQLTDLSCWKYRESGFDVYVSNDKVEPAIDSFLVATGLSGIDKDRIRYHISHEGTVYEDENIKVEYIPTKHCPNSYAILVTEGEKKVLFGGDFSHSLCENDVPRVINEELDAFICEMAHFKMEHLAPYLDQCKAKKVLFTHVWPLDKYNDINAAKGSYPFEILTPNDGDVLEI
jgi:ribonuclease BN (tRNA processing enzyme)